jgi:hypothetical protein
MMMTRCRTGAEHVIGGHVHQFGAGGGARGSDVPRALTVYQESLVLMRLGLVHCRPGRAVDDDGRPVAQECAAYRGVVGDVEILPGQPGHVRAGAARDAD